MELPLAGLIGAMIGTVLGAINYAVVVGFVVGRLRALDKSQTADERAAFEAKVSVLRRLILGLDILVFACIGYWFGNTVGG
jgi:hypothetical protein